MHKPKIGLALGAGGARGFAHIGVLKVIKELNIPVDFIAGSSMGSLIGALYAHHVDLTLLEKLALNLKRKHWLDFTVPGLGFVVGDKVKELVRILTHGKNIEDLPIPLSIVATDIERGERVVFTKGPIDRAVRASVSIPGIFVPERVDGRLLVDGGVIDRVPISVVKDMGADIVIAIDVALYDRSVEITNIFDMIAQTIDVMEREILRNRMLVADIIIRPEVGHLSPTAFQGVEDAIREGERAAREHSDHLLELIHNWRHKE